MRQEELSGSALRRAEEWLTQPSGPETRSTAVSGSGGALPLVQPTSPVSTGPARFFRKKIIACPLAWGSMRVWLLCVCFCVTLRSGRVCFHNLSDDHHRCCPLKPPQLTTAWHICVFYSFLLQVKGCHLARGGGGVGGAHVTLDPGRANGHYSVSSVS